MVYKSFNIIVTTRYNSDEVIFGLFFVAYFLQKLRLSKPASNKSDAVAEKPSARERIIQRAAKELKDGMFVNLGIGIPVLAANHLPKGANICLHGENGIMGLVRTFKPKQANGKRLEIDES